MKNQKLKIVQIIAFVCIAIGLFYLIKNFNANFFFLKTIFIERYQAKQTQMGPIVLHIITTLILILRPIAGLGLLKLKTWGRNLTIAVLSADFIIRAISFYNVHTYALRHPEMAEKVAEMLANGATIVQKTSIIPSYFIAAISLISVIILLKINWKEMK
jgi:hypothetical protein